MSAQRRRCRVVDASLAGSSRQPLYLSVSLRILVPIPFPQTQILFDTSDRSRSTSFVWILSCRYEMLCRICTVHIQSRKHVIDHADCTAPTLQHELDHTDQESICPERSRSSSGKSMIWSMYALSTWIYYTAIINATGA